MFTDSHTAQVEMWQWKWNKHIIVQLEASQVYFTLEDILIKKKRCGVELQMVAIFRSARSWDYTKIAIFNP
jgi:hypothetical protein